MSKDHDTITDRREDIQLVGVCDNWRLVNSKLMPQALTVAYDPSAVEPDPRNDDCTDWPRRGCRRCGARDRPQWEGICNDDRCSHA